jgi:hypothetical protein
MMNFLQKLWAWISDVLFPDEYYSWQTLIYLGIFSFVMSWVARLAVEDAIVDTLIATAGWIFFALGIGWLLDQNDITLFGVPLAPWVMGAIVCTYFFGTFGGSWQLGLMTWPLVSVAIAAIPQFLDWELNPQIPDPKMRQQLILLTLVALLLSNWFQFYFRLQQWFEAYPSLLADDFSRSGFVFRLSKTPEEQAQGIALLTFAQTDIRDSLDDTPWPYVERWLLNLDDKMAQLEQKAIDSLDLSEEGDMWQLQARRPRTLEENGYALDLMAIWSGPASIQNGYYLEKTCVIQPQFPTDANEALVNPTEQPTPLAEVKCDLATPRRPGKPTTV